MPNKTISLPDDVLEIIEGLDVPFSRWVADQLRRHAADSTTPFGRQLVDDAALAEQDGSGVGRRPDREGREETGERMDRSAPW